MTERMDDKQARKYLAAFADGELDVEQNLRVLEHMAMNPQATRRVMHQQQLRQLVGRAASEQAPGAPADLRDKVAGMKVRLPGEEPARRGVLARIGRWLPAAVAAALLVAAGILFQQRPATTVPGGDAAILSAEHASRFARKHHRCTRLAVALNNVDKFPRDVGELPATLKAILGENGELPVLDLSSLGYAYKGAGNCRIPGKESVHLIYEAASATGMHDSLSLWITTEANQPLVEPDRLYESWDASRIHPILFWRHQGLVYYLVGDDAARTGEAAALLRTHG